MSRIVLSTRTKFLLVSALAASILIIIGTVSKDPGVFGNAVILATFTVATPQFLISYQDYRGLKDKEEKFPIFLRDLIENLRSGVAFHKAIISASKVDYGELSSEIKHMAHQLSWGTPIDKVLNQFAARLRKSKRLYTSIKIIRESFVSGGDVVSTLESVADNAILLQDSEKERKSILDQYVVLMYAISFIFIAIVVVINRLLLPIFEMPNDPLVSESIGLTNPCASCAYEACTICSLFEGTSEFYFSIKPGTTASYYTALFFYMAVVQALFSGLVAGQISENSIVAGLKHSLILVGITMGAFSILVKLKLMGV